MKVNRTPEGFIEKLKSSLQSRNVVRRRIAAIRGQCGRAKLSEPFLLELETLVRRAGIHIDRPLNTRSTLLTQTVRFSLHPFAQAEVEFGCEAQLVDLVIGAVGAVAPLENLEVWKRGREFSLPSGKRIDLLCKERDWAGKGTLVAVELKKGKAGVAAVQQLKDYLEELQQHRIAAGRSVRGILLGRRVPPEAGALSVHPFRIDCFEYSFAFKPIQPKAIERLPQH